MTRKLLFILAMAALLAALCFGAALADTGGTFGDGLTWTMDGDGVLTIGGTGPMPNFVWQPSSSWQYSTPWNLNSVRRVIIEEGVTSIGKMAFREAAGLAEVTLPDSLTGISDQAFYQSGITGVRIPGGVSQIGYQAFYQCDSLAEVTIGDGAVSIGESAFYGCDSLAQVTIGDGAVSIGRIAFRGCGSLTGLTIGSGMTVIGVQAFSGCGALATVSIGDGACAIREKAFQECAALTSVTLPDGLTTIDDYAFYCCVNLTDAALPDTLTALGAYAFGYCALTDVTVPGGVSQIYRHTFLGCTDLTEVHIGEGVTKINTEAFSKCGVEFLWLPESLERVETQAFSECGSLKHVFYPGTELDYASVLIMYRNNELTGAALHCGVWPTITEYGQCGTDVMWILEDDECLYFFGSGPMKNYSYNYYYSSDEYIPTTPWYPHKTRRVYIEDGVTAIGNYCFVDFDALTGADLPESVTTIGEGAFRNCTSLADLVLPEGLTAIQSYAFLGCDSLTDLVLPEGITEIQNHAFYECDSLTSLILPEGLTAIKSYAFYGCDKLTDLVLPEGLTTIQNYAFYDCDSLKELTIPDGLTSCGTSYPFDYNTQLYASLASEGAKAVSRAGNSFRRRGDDYDLRYTFTDGEVSGLEICRVDSDVTALDVPDIVTAVGAAAFDNCPRVVRVTLPEGLTSIGDYAFAWCYDLAEVSIPENVTSIGEYAFYECYSLRTLAVPESVTSLDYRVFSYTGLEHVYLGDNVSGIQWSTFYGSGPICYTNPGSVTAHTLSKNGISFREPGTCYNLKYLYDGDEVTGLELSGVDADVTAFWVPEGVTRLGDGAFRACTAPEVYIPASVTAFGDDAFPGGTVYCHEFSDADYWATERGYSVIYIDGVDLEALRRVTLPAGLRLRVGEQRLVKANVFPEYDHPPIAWASDAPDVVSVDGGLLTANTMGTAVITATMGEYTADVTVGVYACAEAFALPEEAWLITRETLSVVPSSVEPAGGELAVSWHSGDEAVATVDENGLITGKKPGDAAITAVSRQTGYAQTMTVHVLYPVTDIALDCTALTLPLGCAQRLTAVVTLNADQYVNRFVTFESSDPAVASVDADGLVTAGVPGEAVVTVAGSSGVSAQCAVTVREPLVLYLPAGLTAIEADAFLNVAADAVSIPATVTAIEGDPFAGSGVRIIYGYPGTAAEAYADAHGMMFVPAGD